MGRGEETGDRGGGGGCFSSVPPCQRRIFCGRVAERNGRRCWCALQEASAVWHTWGTAGDGPGKGRGGGLLALGGLPPPPVEFVVAVVVLVVAVVSVPMRKACEGRSQTREAFQDWKMFNIGEFLIFGSKRANTKEVQQEFQRVSRLLSR